MDPHLLQILLQPQSRLSIFFQARDELMHAVFQARVSVLVVVPDLDQPPYRAPEHDAQVIQVPVGVPPAPQRVVDEPDESGPRHTSAASQAKPSQTALSLSESGGWPCPN
ncbi:hypothetical protein NKR19_g9018 [Coniochaeta hoffmannii]|uniref:Uncharacterized protein n=1 Tax=Coniochaeta hoffmannii TaxID=91930 RepID=A0AA38VE19_9PEZI|nr:hypothetical protein NKR19_g9018 [Coniochaeta hoffmannii]